MKFKTFMIIDDDPEDRYFFRIAVSEIDESIKCIEAMDGENALAILDTIDILPDFIFLDVNMPKMWGSECLRYLKSDCRLAQIPVVMYSTSFSQMTIDEFISLGAAHCLIKPFDLDSLPGKIIDVIFKIQNNSIPSNIPGRNRTVPNPGFQ
jgi:CheY-like chemotaxis protein